jgi:hypothetical protein
MKTIKIKIHSNVDLITNSSTVIFTYSESALPALKELVNEMLKTFDKEETFDDIFYADVFADDYDYTFEGLSWSESASKLTEIKEQVLRGEIERPEWMVKLDNRYDYYDYYSPSTSLEILVKDKKYDKLANKLLSFLYSTNHEATHD